MIMIDVVRHHKLKQQNNLLYISQPFATIDMEVFCNSRESEIHPFKSRFKLKFSFYLFFHS
jgi:hypothetical protein